VQGPKHDSKEKNHQSCSTAVAQLIEKSSKKLPASHKLIPDWMYGYKRVHEIKDSAVLLKISRIAVVYRKGKSPQNKSLKTAVNRLYDGQNKDPMNPDTFSVDMLAVYNRFFKVWHASARLLVLLSQSLMRVTIRRFLCRTCLVQVLLLILLSLENFLLLLLSLAWELSGRP
jgi:hypothetical protein